MPVTQLGDLALYYEELGTGDPVLFLHSGYSRGILAFGGQIQPFSHPYRCLFPDFRGHGRTRCPAPVVWDSPVLARDMLAFLDALDIGRAHLLGYSLGGSVALHMAAMQPGRVRSLITIGCGGVADPTGADDWEPEALEAAGSTEVIARMVALHGEANGGDWRQFMRVSAADWRAYPALTDADWARLTMPLLLIGGERDAFALPARLEAMRARCPQAQTWVVPGAGHRPHMPMEQVQDVNARMLAFLAEV